MSFVALSHWIACSRIYLALCPSDLDLLQKQLRVTGKGNKQRIVPFGDELRETLELYLEERTAYFADTPHAPQLFLNPQGRAYTYAALRKMVHQTLSAVTTQTKKTPHVLRHSFATAMLANGARWKPYNNYLGMRVLPRRYLHAYHLSRTATAICASASATAQMKLQLAKYKI